jgi:hypothetical protein
MIKQPGMVQAEVSSPPHKATLPNERIKFSVTKFINNKKKNNTE